MPEATIDTLQIEITGDAKKGYAALDGLIKRLDKMGKSFESVTKLSNKLDLFATKADGGFGKLTSSLHKAERVLNVLTDHFADWFKESNDYIEALNLFQVTMGKGADAAKDYADKLQNLMGIDIKEWMNYQGSYNQLLRGFGMDDKTSNQMSQQLTQIAYDLSSLWNTDVQTAFQKVQSGMSGQVKGLKVWGINLSVAQLKETALAHGIELSTSKMTEAQKATLRYVTIMERTKNVQGDLARTIVTPANAMRILNAQITQMRRAFGNIVSVIVVRFIPVLQVLVKWLTIAAQKLADFMHFQLPEIDYSGLDTSAMFADDLADGLEDSNKQAKKLKKTLMGFDELNILNAPPDTTSTSVLGGGLPSDLGLDLGQYAYDFTKGLEGIDTTPIENTLKFLQGLLPLFPIAIGLILLFTGHPGWGLALIIVGAATFVAQTIFKWSDYSDKIKGYLGSIAAVVSGALLAIGMILFLLAPTPTSKAIGVMLLIAGVATLATSFVLKWNSTRDKIKVVLDLIIAVVSGALLALGILLLLLSPTPMGKGVGLALLIGGAIGLASQLPIMWDKIPDKVKSKISVITAIVGGALLALGIIILLATAGGAWPLGVGLIVAGATSLAASVAINWDAAKKKIKTVLASILSIISGAGLVLGVLLCLTGTGLGIGIPLIMASLAGVQKAEKISSNPVTKAVKNVVNGVIELVEKGINKIRALLRKFSFSLKVPDWLQEALGTDTIGIDLSGLKDISIPRLANGGMLNAGQLFIAREEAPELVASAGHGRTAVMNNNQIVQAVSAGVYRAVRDAMNEGGSNSQTINIIAELDGEPVYRNTIKRHNNEVKATGSSPLLVGA